MGSRMIRIRFAATFAGFSALAPHLNSAPIRREWVARYDGGAYVGTDTPMTMALDHRGNVYVSGISERISETSLFMDVVTVAYRPDGSPLWVHRFANDSDDPHGTSVEGLAVDVWGNVFVGGTIVTAQGGEDFVLLKYDPDGVLLWSRLYDGPGDPQRRHDHAWGVAVDGEGNAFIAGGSMGVDGSYELVTLKYDPDGVLLWQARCDERRSIAGSPVGMVLDLDGGVYLAVHGIRILRYGSDGRLLWSSTVPGHAFSDMAIDPRGRVVVAGSHSEPGSGSTAFLTAKVDADGRTLWSRTYLDPLRDGAEARAVAVDPEENVYVMGAAWSGSGADWTADYLTIKYGPDGGILWHAAAGIAGDRFGRSLVSALAVDGKGFAYLAGHSWRPGQDSDIVMILYDADGRVLGEARYDEPGSSDFFPLIAVDGDGSFTIAACSILSWTETGSDYLLIRYRLAPRFLRGDATTDGAANIADAVSIARHIFLDAPLPCASAADANDDGQLDLSDAVFVLDYLFRHGAVPAVPFALCGFDPTQDALDCGEYPPCP